MTGCRLPRCSLANAICLALALLTGALIGTADLAAYFNRGGHVQLKSNTEPPYVSPCANVSSLACVCPSAVGATASDSPAVKLPEFADSRSQHEQSWRAIISPSIAWLREKLLRHANSVLPSRFSWRPGNATSVFMSLDEPLLALVGVHVDANGAALRARLRATWAALRAPDDMHLVFVVSVRGTSAALLELAVQELMAEGDILFVSGCNEGVNTKSFAHFATAAALFGVKSYSFFIKADTDTFLLPRPYAALLRALVPVASVEPLFGGNEFARGSYAWASDIDFMAGGCYFVTPDIAAAVHVSCSPICLTNDVASAVETGGKDAAPPSCALCIWNPDHSEGGEDHAFAALVASLPLPAPHHVRLNGFHIVGIGRYGGSGTRLLTCLDAELQGSRGVCPVPPLLAVHLLKSAEHWALFASHYRHVYDFGGGDALDEPFREFIPPPFMWPNGYMLEDDPSWFTDEMASLQP